MREAQGLHLWRRRSTPMGGCGKMRRYGMLASATIIWQTSPLSPPVVMAVSLRSFESLLRPEEARDPAQVVRVVDPCREPHAGAIHVRDVGVHCHAHRCASQQVGTS